MQLVTPCCETWSLSPSPLCSSGIAVISLGIPSPNIKLDGRGGSREAHTDPYPVCWSREMTPRQSKSRSQKREDRATYLTFLWKSGQFFKRGHQGDKVCKTEADFKLWDRVRTTQEPPGWSQKKLSPMVSWPFHIYSVNID